MLKCLLVRHKQVLSYLHVQDLYTITPPLSTGQPPFAGAFELIELGSMDTSKPPGQQCGPDIWYISPGKYLGCLWEISQNESSFWDIADLRERQNF